MEDIFTQLKKAQGVKMTDAERARIRTNLTRISMGHVPSTLRSTPQVSPYVKPSFLGMNMFAKALVLAVIGFIISGSTLTFASLGTLPGSKLYGVKVAVAEKISGAFAFGPDAQAQHQATLVATRLSEIQTLQANGALKDPATSQIAQASFTATFTDYQNSLTTLANQGLTARVQEIAQATLTKVTPSLAMLDTTTEPTQTQTGATPQPATMSTRTLKVAAMAPTAMLMSAPIAPRTGIAAVLEQASSELTQLATVAPTTTETTTNATTTINTTPAATTINVKTDTMSEAGAQPAVQQPQTTSTKHLGIPTPMNQPTPTLNTATSVQQQLQILQEKTK